MLDIFTQIGYHPFAFALCVILALIPTMAWFLIFAHRHTHRWKYVFLTFVAGMGAAALILLYQYFWDTRFDFLFFAVDVQNFNDTIPMSVRSILLSTLLVFFSIGFLEEYSKHWIVKKTDKKIFESIDDVIEFSIIGALGFAFLENIGYFLLEIVENGGENIVSLFFMRSMFVVFIHVLCSGIYGYYYGLAHFAEPLLKEWEKEGKIPRFPRFVHYLTHMRKARVFRDEMTTLGLLIAIVIHGSYDFLLEMGTVGKLVSIVIGREIHFAGEAIQIHVLLLPVLLVFGFLYLSELLRKKEDQKRRGHIEVREEFVFGDDSLSEQPIR